MERLKRSLTFWVVMLGVVVLVPATLLANKQAYKAVIKSPTGLQVGSSFIGVVPPGAVEVRANTNPNLQGQVVQKVTLTNGTWSIAVCETGGPVQDDCEYDVSGRLLIDRDVTSSMLLHAVNGPVTGAAFIDELQAGHVSIQLWDGAAALLGSGAYQCVFGPTC